MAIIATYENFVEAKERGFQVLLGDFKEDCPTFYDECERRYLTEKNTRVQKEAEAAGQPDIVHFFGREIETIKNYDDFKASGYLRMIELKRRNPKKYKEFQEMVEAERNRPYWAR